MDKLKQTIKILEKELNEYHLPEEVDKAMRVARELDLLYDAADIVRSYEYLLVN